MKKPDLDSDKLEIESIESYVESSIDDDEIVCESEDEEEDEYPYGYLIVRKYLIVDFTEKILPKLIDMVCMEYEDGSRGLSFKNIKDYNTACKILNQVTTDYLNLFYKITE